MVASDSNNGKVASRVGGKVSDIDALVLKANARISRIKARLLWLSFLSLHGNSKGTLKSFWRLQRISVQNAKGLSTDCQTWLLALDINNLAELVGARAIINGISVWHGREQGQPSINEEIRNWAKGHGLALDAAPVPLDESLLAELRSL